MRTSVCLLTFLLSRAESTWAFSFRPTTSSSATTTIDISETSLRQMAPFLEWAKNQAGIQTVQGIEVTQSPLGHNNPDGQDYTLVTTQALAADTPVLYVPAHATLSSAHTQDELGGNLEAAENVLEGRADRLSLFRLVIQVLTQVQAGPESPFYPWLDSLPRRFNNGVAMTDACFECLPPYAGYLAAHERSNFEVFYDALQKCYLELDEATLDNRPLIRWAYNVALTRHQISYNSVTGDLDKNVAPMVDLMNHASIPNCQIQYDDDGNCVVTTTTDVPPDAPLTVSYGDPNDPSPLFAKYGFLVDEARPPFFAKPFSGEDEATKEFYTAVTTDNQPLKDAYHTHYFAYTLPAVQAFVNDMLKDVNQKTTRAFSYDLLTHPRVPIIVEHNNLVRDTFLKVKANLDSMAAEQ